jgi:hypothetical protein
MRGLAMWAVLPGVSANPLPLEPIVVTILLGVISRGFNTV